jgi:formylglycine-generating enzyme required for sulfatase activity
VSDYLTSLVLNTCSAADPVLVSSPAFVLGTALPAEPETVFIQGGAFTMGAAEIATPEHRVTVSSFNIGKYEVTQGQWAAVIGNNPSDPDCGIGDNYPINMVSWNDIVGTSGVTMTINGITYYANGFIYRLNQLTGKQYRLPTEAEWEYAARGGNQSLGYTYSGSNTAGDVVWYSDNSGSSTHPVGMKAANELGIHDMNGNVWEWCSDWRGDYSSEAQSNPIGPASGSNRVYRGGSWHSIGDNCRVASRNNGSPDFRYYGLGFRLVLP